MPEAEDAPLLSPGVRIDGRYEVEGLLGRGGLADVFRVRHLELGSACALKVLRMDLPGLRRRLLVEGRVQAMLAHPNVVRVLDVVPVPLGAATAQGLLMELVEGPPLDGVLAERGPLPLPDALSLFSAVLSAVAHAHDSGVLHRDLKPGNVLLAPLAGGLVPKVTDFGLAKVVEDQLGSRTRSGAMMGTPGYMAPEQAKDASTVDRRTDVFSLGSLLYEILAGRNAFADPDGTGPASPLATTERDAPRLDGVPPEIADAVARALARDRDERFPDCASFAAALGLPEPTIPPARLRPGPTAVPPTMASTGSPTVSPTGSETIHLAPAGVSGRWVVAGIVGAVLSALCVAGALLLLFDDAIRWRADRAPVPSAVAEPVSPAPAPPRDPNAPSPAPPAPIVGGRATAPGPGMTPAPEGRSGAEASAPEGRSVPGTPAETSSASPGAASPLEPSGDVLGEEVAPEPAPAPDAAPASPWDGPPVPVPAGVVIRQPPAGRLRGFANRQPFDLDLVPRPDGRLTAEARILNGPTERRLLLAGRYDPLTGAVELQTADGSLRFDGVWDGRALSGEYAAGARRLRWSVTP